jgi:hypothetical protein
MNSAAELIASIPAQVTARDGLVFIGQALADAKAATDEILSRYTGSTLPPPPWPQHAELRTAIDALDGGRLLLNKAIEAGYGDKAEPKAGPLGTRLSNGIRALYREVGVMQQRMKGVAVADLPGLAFDAVKKVATTSIGGWAVALGLLWLLHNAEDL